MRASIGVWAVAASAMAAVAVSGCTPVLAPSLPRGRVLPSVRSPAGDARYAVLLPSSLPAGRRAPIVFAFDPDGQGARAAERLARAAEAGGAIVVASNDSQNGPIEPTARAMEAMWRDARLLPAHPLRFVAAGFSGGARAALVMAERHPAHFDGVIAVGAAQPPGGRMPRLGRGALVIVVGELDFNLGEALAVERAARAGAITTPVWVEVIAGGHAWAPPEVLARGLAFLQATSGPAEAKRRWLDERLARARADEAAGEWPRALSAYRQLARIAVDEGARAAAAEAEARLRAGRAEAIDALEAMAPASLEDRAAVERALLAARRVGGGADPVARRAAGVLATLPPLVLLHAIALARDGRPDAARAWLALVDGDRPSDAATAYNLGCARALLGDEEAASAALREAIARGFRDRAHLVADPDLTAFLETPAGRAILALLR